jgi:hypothetical protein
VAAGYKEIIPICRALSEARHSAIEAICLKNNQLGSTGVAQMTEFIGASPTLTKLDVSRNDIGIAGFALLSDALHANPIFSKLYVVSPFWSPSVARLCSPRVFCQDYNLFTQTPAVSALLEKNFASEDVRVCPLAFSVIC